MTKLIRQDLAIARMIQLLVPWAVTSSALILVVLAVRYLFRKKLSARLKYALWGVVLLRLLVPFQIELPTSASDALPMLASNLAQDVPTRLEEHMLYAIPTRVFPDRVWVQPGEPPEYSRTLHGGIGSDWDSYSGGVKLDENGTTRYFFMMPASELLVNLWKCGTGLCLLVILYSNWGFSLRLGRRRKPLEVPDAPIPVYTAEGLPSPCLFGVFRPAVYVTPQAAENPDTLRHVLAHELTHYAHKDHLWSLLRCLALALHWYNPLVWLAAGLSKGDGELACDEGAVARLGEAERIPYGRTLVDMVAARSLRPGDLLSCSTAMTGGGKSVKQRVAQLVKKPETVKAALFAVIAVVALAAVFVFAERGPARQENKMLSDYLDRTTAISYCPPIHSSQLFPNPITKEDLLAEAKEALSGFRLLEDGDPPPDLSPGAVLHESRIILTLEDGGETEYSLLWQNDRTYLFPGSIWRQSMDLQEEEGETAQLQGVSGTCISKEGDNVIDTLRRLAGRSTRKVEATASPELDQFFTDLESAQAIFVGQPMLSSANPPGLISDPEARARAKELLGKASGPIQLSEGVTREEFWESIRYSLSNTTYQDMEEPPTITRKDLEEMLFTQGCSILLCPAPEVTPDMEYRYWLADRNLLLWDAEQEEEPIKLLATYSEDVYSQLAELARTNGSRYRVDAAEYPEALEELIRLFVNDEDFLSQNAQAKNTTPEDIAAWLKGEGSEPVPPEVLIISRGTWTLSAFGDGSLLFIDLTIPDHLIVQIQHICQSFGIEISW